MENPTEDNPRVTGENAAAEENKTHENAERQSDTDNTKSVQTEDLVAIIVTTEQKNMLDSIYRLRLDHEVNNLIKQKEQSTENPETGPIIIDDDDDSDKELADKRLVTAVISDSDNYKKKLLMKLYIMKRRYEIQKDYMYINSIDPNKFKPFEMPETSIMITQATQTRDGESYNDVQIPEQDASHLPTISNVAFSGLPQSNRFEQENLQDYNTIQVQPTTSYAPEVQVPTEEPLTPKQHGAFPGFPTNMPVCNQGQYYVNAPWSCEQTQNIRCPNAEQQHVSRQHGFLQHSTGHQVFPQQAANSYDAQVQENLVNQQTQTRFSISQQVQSLIQQRPSHLLACQQRPARPSVNQQRMSRPSLSQQRMRLSHPPVISEQVPQRSVKHKDLPQTTSHQVYMKRPLDQHDFKLPERPVSKRGKSGAKNQNLEHEQIRLQKNAWGYQPDANYPNCNWTTEGRREEQDS